MSIKAQRQKNVIKNDCFFLCLRIYLYPRVENTRQVLLNGTLSVNEGITAVCFCVRFAFFCEKFFNSSEKSNVLRALLKGAFFMKNFNVKNLFFSSAFLNAGKAKKLALLGIFTAINVVFNTVVEIRFADIQFSLTIFMSAVTGSVLGSLCGFVSCFLGDFLGYVFNSWGLMYMPWVGLATGVTAFVAGIVVNGFNFKFKGSDYIKAAIVSVITFVLCTVLINSTGFYLYNYKMGFSQAVIDYVKNTFGGEVGYFGYVAYRLFFKGQIFNCLVNYTLFIVVLPQILKIKTFKGVREESEETVGDTDND